MLNFFCKDYKLLVFRAFDFANIGFSFLYYNNYLLLKNPKLINFLSKRFSDSLTTIKIKEIVDNDINTISTNSSKFDKKQKGNLYGQNSKKAKSKIVKNKIKNSLPIEDVNLFDNRSDNLFNQDLLNRSSGKLRKINNKVRKNDKEKDEMVSNESSFNHLNHYNRPIDKLNLNISEKSIKLDTNLTIQELSKQMNIPEAEIITYLFLNKGISATINELLDLSIVRNIAKNYGYKISETSSHQAIIDNDSEQNSSYCNNIRRPLIITILGHVDHGKTTLLDTILKTNLVSKEQGGITQAITGYEVIWNYLSQDYSLVFLDTPGHESFQQMRLRGAKVTDIVLLVVAIDDGLKPQTIEAVNYINQMKLYCIVVITKCDKSSNNSEIIKRDLAGYNLLCEQWGGNVPFIEVSALSGYNIDLLLSQVCLFADKKNFLADPSALATGTILESYLDKKQGPVANLIVQNGTLSISNIIASGNIYGKVKSMISTNNLKIRSSGPSSLVKVLAFNSLPEAGSKFLVYKNEKDAKAYCLQYSHPNEVNFNLKLLDTRITLNRLSDIKQLKIILRSNTQGSLEAILNLLSKISQSKVQINVVSASCGNISNADVELAIATSAIIIGFDVNILNQIKHLLKQYQITFKVFDVVYDLLDYVKTLMLDLIKPEHDKVLSGQAVVQTVFNMNRGCVAGCLVTDGRLSIKSYIHVYRNKLLVYQGSISSLKQIKNDVQEVNSPNECGLMADFDSWQDHDTIKAYDLISKEKTL